MKKVILLFLLQLALFANQTPKGVTITNFSDGILVEFNLPEFSFLNVDNKNGTFTKIIAEDFGVKLEPGYPALPIISFNVSIPDFSSGYSIETIRFSNESQILENPIYPYQKPFEKNKPISERPFTINTEYYKTEGSINQPVIEETNQFIINGVKGLTITINPFAYNPAENILVTRESISFIINFKGSVSNHPVSENWNNYFESIFVNFSAPIAKSGINYLIISKPEFEDNLENFINYKSAKGYNVSLYSTNETGTTTASIKSFIQNLYSNPTTKPEFILLVGDVQDIPAWTGSGEGSPKTDLNYVQLEGNDYFADAFIGRFSVTDDEELANIISKTIYMDQNIASLQKNNVFMASTDNYNITEGTHNYVIDNFFDPDGYNNQKLYTVTYNATTQDLINALNSNKQFAIYSGHGGETSWADGPALSASQVYSLTNTYYPFVYSFACVTGSYQISESFGETWIRAENGGSSFYGSSVNSYWDEDDVLEKEIFRAWYEEDLTKVTPMMDKGKIEFVNHYGGSVTPGSTQLRYLEMYNLMGDPSLGTKIQILPDDTPPEQITDLSAESATSNSVTLNWTAPYDSTYGGVISYDIRYSTEEILDENDFNNAEQVYYGGNSDSAGTPKSFEVKDLQPATMYYFAAKALDIWSNTSLMSNTTLYLTWDAPSISVSPESLTKQLPINTIYKDSVVIANVSGNQSTLNYSVELTNNTFPENVKFFVKPVLNNSEKSVNKSIDIKGNGYSGKGMGGPDQFGYEWIDSDEENGPEYSWEDISVSGTLVTGWMPTGSFDPMDEGYAGPIALDFDFKFYGNNKGDIYLSSNGFLTFSPLNENTYTNEEIPSISTPNELIAPLWDDLDGKTNGKVYYKKESSRVIFQYDNWSKYSGTGSLTFQIILNKSGKIEFLYNTISASVDGATVGIENAQGNDGLGIAFNSSYIHNQLAVEIAAEPDWLGAENLSGMLYNDNSAAVILEFMTEDLEDGEYSMDLVITSNDPAQPEITVPIKMFIGELSENWACNLTIFDAGGLRGGGDNYQFGMHPMATDGIDEELGEYELPPIPPTNIFDARFYLPDEVTSSYTDLRNLYQDAVQWKVAFQAGEGGYPVTLQWDVEQLPQGNFYMKDVFGGLIFNVNMKDTNQYVINNIGITSLLITYEKTEMMMMPIVEGWNMISMPLHASSMMVDELFPDAVSSLYSFNNEYSVADSFQMGEGYWLKFDVPAMYELHGTYHNGSVTVNEGWNIIGPFAENVNVNSITSTPENIISSVFYGFNGSYQLAEELQPGHGYWVKISDNGELHYNGIVKSDKQFNQLDENLAIITISDATGKSSVLYYGNGKNEMFELPPLPPSGVFDARYSTNMMIEDGSAQININDAVYPITILVNGAELNVSDAISSDNFSKILKSGDKITIENSEINKIKLNSLNIPSEFSLSQNYPNPFNPSTKISFSLPEKAIVKLAVYDILGREVAILADMEFDVGNHQVIFNASEFASGMYIYKLTSDKFVESRKMLLLK